MRRGIRLLLFYLLCSSAALQLCADEAPALILRSYPARVVEITDGDTVKVDIDLGFGVTMSRVAIRMAGVYAPERDKPGGPEAAARLKELLPVGVSVVLRPVMSIVGREQMSFARYVGRIWRGDLDVCEAMTQFLSKSNPKQ